MQVSSHLCGGAPLIKKVKIGASFANAGIPAIDSSGIGAIPCTTTDAADAWGLALEAATYSTTQGAAEGLVSIDIRPDCVIRALMSGGATEGTVLPTLSANAASTTGLTIADTDCTEDMVSGTIWCTKGANVGQSRTITTHNDNVSYVVTVPFLYDIAAGDEFLYCPYNASDAGIGAGNVQTTTLFTQANAFIVSGTGLVAAVVDLELRGSADSQVLFILADHAFGTATL